MAFYHERYRPQVHYSAQKNFLNDPNGLVYHQGEYHLFYQHNPFGNTWGNMSWGHAVSQDLIHWRELPVALLAEEQTLMFSGSAVYDARNMSGIGANGTDPLVLIYTGHQEKPSVHDAHELTGEQRETQNLALSTDGGRTWTKYEGNPVLDLGAPHLRDPKVLWYEPDQRWIMILAGEPRARFFGSTDLKNWEHLSDFGPAGVPDVPNWECPELFELPVDGDTAHTRWVLKVDIGDKGIAGGSGAQYFVGHFDGERFHNDNDPDTVLWVDYGADFYAAQSFNNMPSSDDRRIWIAWMSNWRYADFTPTHPWRGAMSVPRQVSLTQTPDGIRLRQQPIDEFASLREEAIVAQDVRINSASGLDDPLRLESGVFELEVEFVVGTASRFGVQVRKGNEERTTVGYDTQTKDLYVDRRQSGRVDFHEAFASVTSAPLRVADGGIISLRLIVDEGSVEVFGGRGEAVITDIIFPDPESTELSLFADDGSVQLRFLRAYPLKSIWQQARIAR